MLLFIILEIGIGLFLYTHRNKSFLVFKPQNNPLLNSVIKNFGLIFIIIGILTFIILSFKSTLLISISLIIGCIVIVSFQLTMVKFFPK